VNSALTLKTFTDTGCATHLIGCRATKDAVLIDPKAGQTETYLETARRMGLRIRFVLDTHTHADHVSDSASFLGRGVELWMSAETTCKRPHRAIADGEEVRVGELRLRALHVPGHTPDSIALYGHGIVATGDTLLAGSLGRADFRGSDPSQLFENVRAKLLALPDETLVLPGHGYRDVLFSTIGHERAHNPALRADSGASYASALGLQPGAGNSRDVDEVLALNVEARPRMWKAPRKVAACCAAAPSQGLERPAELEPEALATALEHYATQHRWIDVRDPYEFAQEHIPGTWNIPLSELGLHLEELRRADPVVISCRSGVRSITAARTLRYLRILSEPISLAGGIVRWHARGLPIAKSA
jgi:glyoxylase-like metal-dependent hydrolase (beta-lactamase superfamily II)/rhodanese-related sulfurtransferase